MIRRPRRLRKTSAIRAYARENSVNKQDLIFPLFLVNGQAQKIEISSMPLKKFLIYWMRITISS